MGEKKCEVVSPVSVIDDQQSGANRKLPKDLRSQWNSFLHEPDHAVGIPSFGLHAEGLQDLRFSNAATTRHYGHLLSGLSKVLQASKDIQTSNYIPLVGKNAIRAKEFLKILLGAKERR